MANNFPYLVILLLISLNSSAKIENLFGDLYKGDVYGGYLKTDIEGTNCTTFSSLVSQRNR